MKIALLQQNFTVGDLAGNGQKIWRGIQEADPQGADLVVSTEFALFGYPPKDMLLNPDYLKAHDAELAKLDRLIKTKKRSMGLIVGIAERNYGDGKPLFNSAVLVQKYVTPTIVSQKQLLPTYDVFDESRHCEPGQIGRASCRERV